MSVLIWRFEAFEDFEIFEFQVQNPIVRHCISGGVIQLIRILWLLSGEFSVDQVSVPKRISSVSSLQLVVKLTQWIKHGRLSAWNAYRGQLERRFWIELMILYVCTLMCVLIFWIWTVEKCPPTIAVQDSKDYRCKYRNCLKFIHVAYFVSVYYNLLLEYYPIWIVHINVQRDRILRFQMFKFPARQLSAVSYSSQWTRLKRSI